METLSEREKSVLRHVIRNFILTAAPVGSRHISRNTGIGYSAATIRNVMADLEESGYLEHPHTSAGRAPTDKGYRYYVDSLMRAARLSKRDREKIAGRLDPKTIDNELVVDAASKLLSDVTRQLACVMYPRLASGTLEKIRLVELSSSRVLVVVTVRAGLVKTITLELDSEVEPRQLEEAQTLLNERFAGLTLGEIRETFAERMKDVDSKGARPILNIFFDRVDKLFVDERTPDKAAMTGASHLVKQPEFDAPEKFRGVVEMIEERDMIVHIMEKSSKGAAERAAVAIGKELEDEQLDDYSVVVREYKIGNSAGALGVVGPKRMEYSKIVAIVDYIANTLTDMLKNPN
jgi:heat-inducible transcriptional repressor